MEYLSKVLNSFGNSDGCTKLWMYLIPLNCTLKTVKMANFMSYVFYHNLKKITL